MTPHAGTPRNRDGGLRTFLLQLTGRNALNRRCDTVHAWMLLVLTLLAVTVVPAATLLTGSTRAARWEALRHHQQTITHTQTAVVVRTMDGSPWLGRGTPAVVRWTAPDGTATTGTGYVGSAAAPGQPTTIWLDANGRPAPPPITHRDVTNAAGGEAALAGIVTAAAVAGLFAAEHTLVVRRRRTGWDREWRAVEPRWSRRTAG